MQMHVQAQWVQELCLLSSMYYDDDDYELHDDSRIGAAWWLNG